MFKIYYLGHLFVVSLSINLNKLELMFKTRTTVNGVKKPTSTTYIYFCILF